MSSTLKHSERSDYILPGVEYNDIPAPHLEPLPDPISVPKETQAPPFMGLLEKRALRKLINAEVDYLDEVRHDNVTKAMALGAQYRRGFSLKGAKYRDPITGEETTGSTMEPEHLRPKHLLQGSLEKINSKRRQRQVTRRDHHHHEAHGIAEFYTVKPKKTDFLPDNYGSLSLIKQRTAMNEAAKKARLHPGKLTLGTSEHKDRLDGILTSDGRIIEPPALINPIAGRAERKDIKRYHKHEKKVEKIQRSLDRGWEGDTLPARIRERKIERKQRKIVKQQRKLDNYDRLDYLRKMRKADSAHPDSTTRVPAFDWTRTNGRVTPDKVPLEAPEVREIQEKFGEKWADDIDIQLRRSKDGRNTIINQEQGKFGQDRAREIEAILMQSPDGRNLVDEYRKFVIQDKYGRERAAEIEDDLYRTPDGISKVLDYEQFVKQRNYGEARARELLKSMIKSPGGKQKAENYRDYVELSRTGNELAKEIEKILLSTPEGRNIIDEYRKILNEDKYGRERAAEIDRELQLSPSGRSKIQEYNNFVEQDKYGRERAAEIEDIMQKQIIDTPSGQRLIANPDGALEVKEHRDAARQEVEGRRRANEIKLEMLRTPEGRNEIETHRKVVEQDKYGRERAAEIDRELRRTPVGRKTIDEQFKRP